MAIIDDSYREVVLVVRVVIDGGRGDIKLSAAASDRKEIKTLWWMTGFDLEEVLLKGVRVCDADGNANFGILLAPLNDFPLASDDYGWRIVRVHYLDLEGAVQPCKLCPSAIFYVGHQVSQVILPNLMVERCIPNLDQGKVVDFRDSESIVRLFIPLQFIMNVLVRNVVRLGLLANANKQIDDVLSCFNVVRVHVVVFFLN
mmetsp:Transcript_1576/g.2817  ORF Transcript_1576/g.2817 Transcript_1576/m.2817 type:complete len:201 (-) Transcript_1576:11472-12074(-)